MPLTGWKIAVLVLAGVLGLDLYLAWDVLVHNVREWRAVDRRGFVYRRFTDEAGGTHGYVLFVPHELGEDERPPLILFLNGVGENGGDGIRQISNNFGEPVWEMKRRFPFVCLAPQCREGGSWEPGSLDTKWMLDNLEQVIEEYGVDPDRVFLTGPSAGGSGTWTLAAAYPERFAGIIPLAGSSCGMPIEEAARIYAEANVAVWSFWNAGDEPGLVEFNRTMRERLIAEGLSPYFTEYNLPGHNCWDDAYRTPALYDWMLRQNKRDNAQRGKFRPLLSEHGVANWIQEGSGEWCARDGVLRASVTGVSCEGRSLFSPELRDSFEIHFDYQSDGERPCEIVLRKAGIDESPESDLRVIIEWPHRGTGGLYDPENEQWLAGTDAVAQRGLEPGRWNDIRVKVAEGRFLARVNGLKLIEAEIPAIRGEAVRFGLRSTATEAGQQQWRFLRIRTPAD